MTLRIPFSRPRWSTEEQLAAGLDPRREEHRRRLSALLEHTFPGHEILLLNRGRSALVLLLHLLEVRPGDEVILPAYICSTVLAAVHRVRAVPVPGDMDTDLNLSPRSVQALITPRTRAVIVPHLFGHPAAVDEISELAPPRVRIIDDAAQSYGSRLQGRLLGSLGHGGLLVCGPGKALAGPAGAALLYPGRLPPVNPAPEPSWLVGLRYRRFVREKVHRETWRPRPPRDLSVRAVMALANRSPLTGVRRIGELDAAVMNRQMETFADHAGRRRTNARALLRDLAGLPFVRPLRGEALPVRLPLLCADGAERGALLDHLDRHGIELHSPYIPLHRLFPELHHAPLPRTDHTWERVVPLPLDETPEDTAFLSRTIADFFDLTAGEAACR